MHLVYCPLDDDMCARFQRKRAGLLLEFRAGERALNVSWACVVAFDQVRVVAIHHADEVREFSRAVRVQPLSWLGRFPLDVDRKVGQFGGSVIIEEARSILQSDRSN